MRTDEWLTPPELIRSLGEFDLDPCAPIVRPWSMAKNHFTIRDDGLARDWFGRVWMNPPYHRREIWKWLWKLATHGNGLALILARTETVHFQEQVFAKADSILFLRGRITFYRVNGEPADDTISAPSVLVAYGDENSASLHSSNLPGKHVLLNRIGIVVAGYDATWRVIIKSAIVRLNKPASIDEITEIVERMAPDKVRANAHYKPKIRQTLTLYFSRIQRGIYSLPSSQSVLEF